MNPLVKYDERATVVRPVDLHSKRLVTEDTMNLGRLNEFEQAPANKLGRHRIMGPAEDFSFSTMPVKKKNPSPIQLKQYADRRVDIRFVDSL